MTDQQTSNPLLNTLRTRIPGETFRLPSQGVFYKNGELADGVNNGEVHIFPITALDEIEMKSPDKLLSGEALIDIFRRRIPQVIKPEMLLAKDVDYIMMCMRAISYGSSYPFTYTHSCDGAKEHHYEIDLYPIIQATVPLDPTTVGDNYTTTTESGQTVKFRPARFGDMMKMYQAMSIGMTKDPELIDMELRKTLIDAVVAVIEEVDGITNPEHIIDWLLNAPSMYTDFLLAEVGKASSWGANPVCEFTCRDCGESVIQPLPINPITFFM